VSARGARDDGGHGAPRAAAGATAPGVPDDRWLRYLRQRAELGVREWVLDPAAAARLRAILAGAASASAGVEPATAAAPASGGSAVAPPAPAGSAAGRARAAPGSEPAGPAYEGGEDDPFEAVRREALCCTRCPLAATRTQVVFGEGDRHAELMVVGEAPGVEEDRTGRPFVGPAGKLLDTLLLAAGFRRDEVYICNVLKCRPPGNRDPQPDEVAACAPYLEAQIRHVAPRVIAALGRFAAHALLGTEASLARLRGTEHEVQGIPVIVTYHPAALLRNPGWTRAAWEDLQRVRRSYERAGGRPPRGVDLG
jgi:uracil-DNA glycosylase family 4